MKNLNTEIQQIRAKLVEAKDYERLKLLDGMDRAQRRKFLRNMKKDKKHG